ncbi:MAG TPA: hypothetical protein VNJ53_06120, partial [Gaiellaceae bacterium]|nr:hypothetical protein [Gaiellaceae bacterium]
MAAPRRRAGRAAILARERAPRLVLRFALVLSLSLALASAVILVVVRHFALSEAERAATRHASLVASALLQREVEPRDLARPVAGARRRELDAVFRPLVRTEDVLGIRLVRHDGLVTYATDRRGAGTTGSAALAAEAAGGTIVSRAAHAPGDEKVLETYAPANGRDLGGAAVIVQSYAPIHAAARSAQLRVGVVLEALLVLLLLVFVPLLARVTRRIR